jgi:hypothetical protein
MLPPETVNVSDLKMDGAVVVVPALIVVHAAEIAPTPANTAAKNFIGE